MILLIGSVVKRIWNLVHYDEQYMPYLLSCTMLMMHFHHESSPSCLMHVQLVSPPDKKKMYISMMADITGGCC